MIIFIVVAFPTYSNLSNSIILNKCVNFHILSLRQIQIFACIQTQQKPEIYLFLYVTTIPTTEAKKAIGASLTNKNSNPCIIVPATANSGAL